MAAPSALKVQLFGHSFVRHLKDFIRHDTTLRFDLNLQGHPLVQYSWYSGARVDTLHDRLTVISDSKPEIVVLIIGTDDIYDSSCSIISVANKIENLGGKSKFSTFWTHEIGDRQQSLPVAFKRVLGNLFQRNELQKMDDTIRPGTTPAVYKHPSSIGRRHETHPQQLSSELTDMTGLFLSILGKST